MALSTKAIVANIKSHEFTLKAAAYAHLRDYHAVEDCVQEACIVAIDKASLFDDAEHCIRYAFGVVRNLARRYDRKSRNRLRFIDSESLQQVSDCYSAHMHRNTSSKSLKLVALEEKLLDLSDYQRTLLKLKYEDRLLMTEIARRLDKSATTVYRELDRVRSSLREKVCPEEVQISGAPHLLIHQEMVPVDSVRKH